MAPSGKWKSDAISVTRQSEEGQQQVKQRCHRGTTELGFSGSFAIWPTRKGTLTKATQVWMQFAIVRLVPNQVRGLKERLKG